MKKSVLLLTFITILVTSYTSASAQVATTGSSLALRLAQGNNTPSGAAILTSGGIVATAAAKVHVVALPAFAQPVQGVMVTAVAPFTVENAAVTSTVTMAQELSVFIEQERALKQRSWFRKKK